VPGLSVPGLTSAAVYRNTAPAKVRDEDAAMAEKTVSLRGLKCPLPALRTRKLLAGMTRGDVLVIECTDPLSAIDIPNLLRQTRDALEDKAEADGVLTFRIRKT
jgi:tRNA 2-thiouridine synthesizing protein A